MQIIIDVPEEDYNFVKKQVADGITNPLKMCIANGTPIPDNITNGDVIKALFPNEYDFETDFDEEWWNAPYQKGDK